jgi:hypothetical protein
MKSLYFMCLMLRNQSLQETVLNLESSLKSAQIAAQEATSLLARKRSAESQYQEQQAAKRARPEVSSPDVDMHHEILSPILDVEVEGEQEDQIEAEEVVLAEEPHHAESGDKTEEDFPQDGDIQAEDELESDDEPGDQVLVSEQEDEVLPEEEEDDDDAAEGSPPPDESEHQDQEEEEDITTIE